MTADLASAVERDLIRRALDGADEARLVSDLCDGLADGGLPVNRALFVVDTLHPIHEGRVFRWRNDGVEEEGEFPYGRTDVGEAADSWRRSIFFAMQSTGTPLRRCRLDRGEGLEHEHMRELVDAGYTDYVALIQPLGAAAAIGDLDCIYGYFATREPDGFDDASVASLGRLMPLVSLALKGASLSRIASTLVEVYLGRDARERVLKGRIRRGVAERIETVLWFSDLRSFTTITDTAAPEEIIPLLNDYSGAVIDAVHGEGGDVLKLIGDGILAIFNFDDAGRAAAAALRAERSLRGSLAAVDARRRAGGRPVTEVYLGLHIGEAFYGNIGSDDRLDFTVVGPSVNEVARIGALCRSVDRRLLASDAFRAALPEAMRARLVSVGRFALRGVGRAQDLHTLDPGLD